MQNQTDIQSMLARYWGKADPTVAAAYGHDHHTVLGHSLDVAACAYILVERNATLREQLGASSGIAGDFVAITFAAACALHDVGKLDTRFQRKAPAVADALRPHTAAIQRAHYDHGTEGFRQIEDDEASSTLLHRFLGTSALPILRAVCGHHGALPTREEPDASRSKLPGSIRREDAEARRVFQECVLEFFVSRGATLPWPTEVDGALVQRLAGLCAVADWLGSNVDHFRYSPGAILDLGATGCVRVHSRPRRARRLASSVRRRWTSTSAGYSRDIRRAMFRR